MLSELKRKSGKVVPFKIELIEVGKKWVHSEKVGAFRANKSQKGGLFLRHIPVLL